MSHAVHSAGSSVGPCSQQQQCTMPVTCAPDTILMFGHGVPHGVHTRWSHQQSDIPLRLVNFCPAATHVNTGQVK